jgi:two-component system, OmpR family, response regulator VicR
MEAMRPGNKQIIYVEDDPDLIRLVTIILNRKGYTVTGVTEGLKGFPLIQDQQPDVVLLDLMMPDMDGWDLFRQLEIDDSTRHIPVIIITAKAQPIDKVLGLYIARVDGYICKPFKPDELLDTIERLSHPHKEG